MSRLTISDQKAILMVVKTVIKSKRVADIANSRSTIKLMKKHCRKMRIATKCLSSLSSPWLRLASPVSRRGVQELDLLTIESSSRELKSDFPKSKYLKIK